MSWAFAGEILYALIVIAVCVHIIFQTDSTVKTLAYLLIVIFIPFFGMLFYLSFGLNYRKKELYSKKLIANDALWQKLKTNLSNISAETYYSVSQQDRPSKHLTSFLANEMSP